MTDEDRDQQRWPVGFIVLVVAAGLYLLLRFIQMGGWLVDWLGG